MYVRSVVQAGVIAVGVLLGAAACASKPVPFGSPATSAPASATASSAASPTASGAASPAASQSPLPAASGQLTGTQLQTVLLPQSAFPTGFSLASSSATSSGGSLETTPAAYDLATMSCASFVEHLGNTGFGESAIASNSFVGTRQAFDQVVYQFATATAASKFVAGIQALAGRCRSFTAKDNGSSGTFALKAAPGAPVAGHSSLELDQTGTISGSALTLDTLFAASGVDVFAAAGVGLGAAAPASPLKQTLIYELMKRQTAEAVLG
jgi:hypothetical protein